MYTSRANLEIFFALRERILLLRNRLRNPVANLGWSSDESLSDSDIDDPRDENDDSECGSDIDPADSTIDSHENRQASTTRQLMARLGSNNHQRQASHIRVVRRDGFNVLVRMHPRYGSAQHPVSNQQEPVNVETPFVRSNYNSR